MMRLPVRLYQSMIQTMLNDMSFLTLTQTILGKCTLK